MGGVQGGFDYQFATNWVIGAEAQYSWLANATTTACCFPGRHAGDLEQQPARLGHRPARLHLGAGAALRQGRLRLARQSNNIGVSVGGAPVAFTTDGNHKDGYTVGAGLEYMFAPNWSAKAEYQYYNFGNTTFTGGPAPIVGSRFRDDEHTVKARRELPLRLGRPGRRALLTPFRVERYEKAGFVSALVFVRAGCECGSAARFG